MAVVTLVAVVISCSTVVVGWWTEAIEFAALIGRSPMKMNIAVSIALLAGGSLVRILRGRTGVERWIGVAAVVTGAATLLQDLLSVSFGIDQLLVTDRWGPPAVDPGRAAPQASVALVCLGLVLALGARAGILRRTLVDAVMVLGALALFGRALHVDAFVTVGRRYALPADAAVAMILTATGLALAGLATDRCLLRRLLVTGPGGVLVRRLVPVAVGLPALGGVMVTAAGDSDPHTVAWGVSVGAAMVSVAAVLRASTVVERLLGEREVERGERAALVDAIPFELVLVDTSGSVRYANAAAEGMDDVKAHRLASATIASGAKRREVWVDVIDGRMRRREVIATPTIAGANVTGAAVLVHDISELVDGEARYRVLLETVPDGIYETTLDGALLYANDALAAIVGFTSGEQMRRDVASVSTLWADPQRREAWIEDIRNGEREGLLDIDLLHRDGTLRTCELRYRVGCDVDDRPIGVMGTLRDVTDERASFSRLTQAEERFRLAFHSGPLGRVVLDLRGPAPRFAEVNEAIARVLGYKVEELLQTDPLSLVHPDDLPLEEAHVRHVAASPHATGDFRTRRRHRDGTWIPVRLTGGVVADVEGRPELAIASVEDLRPQLEAERIRAAAHREAETQARFEGAVSTFGRAALGGHLDTGEVTDLAAATLHAALGATLAAFFPATADAPRHVGGDRRTLALPYAQSTEVTEAQRAMTTQAPVVVDDWDLEPRSTQSPTFAAHRIRSSIAVPCVGRTRTHGVLVIGSAETHPYDGQEIAFAESIARTLSLSLEQLEASAALAASQRTLESFVENAPAAVYLLDTAGRFLVVNRETERVIGLPREQLIGATRHEIPGFVNAGQHREHDLAVIASRKPHTFEETTTEPDGEHTFLSVKFPIEDDRGSVIAVGGISTDVTPLKQAQQEAQHAWAETIRRIAVAVEYRDEETGGHIDRMAQYCGLIAVSIGLDEDFAAELRRAAPLHDAGKIAVPDAVLLKPGALTPEERKLMETHAEVGYRLLTGSGNSTLELAATIAWTHHERCDGSGYPRGLRGAEIPLEGRIAAVADVFDALTTDRVYRSALPVSDAIAFLTDRKGTEFDADVVDAMVAVSEAAARRCGDAGERQPAPNEISDTGRSAHQTIESTP